MTRHFVSIHDFTAEEIRDLFVLSAEVKRDPHRFHNTLARKTLAMIFEKSSTRTRVSFEVGMYQLGGTALFLSSRDIQLGRGEPIADTARVLARYCDGIMARTFAHQTVLDLAQWSSVPVVNGLTDLLHPCQAMTDFFTMMEKWGGSVDALKGRKLAWIGDGNNMAHSLMYAAAKVGVNLAVATPPGYEPSADVVQLALADAAAAGVEIVLTNSMEEAVEGADAVETDVWASMGQEGEAAQRRADFAGWEVTEDLMLKAKSDAIFLHCLPAHRGEEVSAEVCDGPRSVIFDEAENRLHVQKAILLKLMGGHA